MAADLKALRLALSVQNLHLLNGSLSLLIEHFSCHRVKFFHLLWIKMLRCSKLFTEARHLQKAQLRVFLRLKSQDCFITICY